MLFFCSAKAQNSWTPSQWCCEFTRKRIQMHQFENFKNGNFSLGWYLFIYFFVFRFRHGHSKFLNQSRNIYFRTGSNGRYRRKCKSKHLHEGKNCIRWIWFEWSNLKVEIGLAREFKSFLRAHSLFFSHSLLSMFLFFVCVCFCSFSSFCQWFLVVPALRSVGWIVVCLFVCGHCLHQ